MENNCNGVIFKVKHQIHKYKYHKITDSIILEIDNNFSCTGCEYCESLRNALYEINSTNKIIGIEKCIPNELYRLDATNISFDREGGWIDDFDLILTKLYNFN